MAQVELTGTVVAQDPDNPLLTDAPPPPHDGLYMYTDEGRLIELICDSMVTQVAIDFMWRRSRRAFEAYLGQRITVEGYLSRRTLYSARIKEPLADSFQGPLSA